MKVLMLGWEYPPLISGGLATACEGLTIALAAGGVEIDFVLPRRSGRESAAHMSLLACDELRSEERAGSTGRAGATERKKEQQPLLSGSSLVGSVFSAYARPTSGTSYHTASERRVTLPPAWDGRDPATLMRELLWSRNSDFSRDPLSREVSRYARELAQGSKGQRFDLIHAHDWMTFPAGILLASELDIPLVVHMHSLEYDRSGESGNPLVRAIETLGARNADRVIAVSRYTARIISERLGVTPERISVVHNAVAQEDESKPATPDASAALAATRPRRGGKRVLFLGRVTYQKGPDYFVNTAALVVKHDPTVTFVLAGTGDMLPQIQKRVIALGLQKNFEFPGFVSGEGLESEFRRADLYVMPSVSEPFGIAPLEALARGTPALISKQSGVSEVLSHALKSDFWDVRKMADFILTALEHPELGRTMMLMSGNEVRRLRWERAAQEVVRTYETVLTSDILEEAI